MKTFREHWAGHSNGYPPNLELIDEADFWRRWLDFYHHAELDSRWLTRPETPAGAALYGQTLTLFVDTFSKSGVGFVRNVGEKPVLFVRFYQCDHEMSATGNAGRCLTNYECVKCGHSYTVDSSG